MRLLKHNVPWDVATSLSPARRLAMLVVGGTLDGGDFNWTAMRWREKK